MKVEVLWELTTEKMTKCESVGMIMGPHTLNVHGPTPVTTVKFRRPQTQKYINIDWPRCITLYYKRMVV